MCLLCGTVVKQSFCLHKTAVCLCSNVNNRSGDIEPENKCTTKPKKTHPAEELRCFLVLFLIAYSTLVPLQESLDDATDPWGIKVERVEIKDVKLPQQLQRAMAAEAEASREARAKVKRAMEDSI